MISERDKVYAAEQADKHPGYLLMWLTHAYATPPLAESVQRPSRSYDGPYELVRH